MPRIRTIKPDFWTDETLTECSMSARLMFIGMLNFADDNGNMERSSKQIKMRVFPADNVDCEELLQELITHGVVNEYSVIGKKYLHIKGFRKHQVINRPSKTNIPLHDSVSTHGVGNEDSMTEEEGKGKEGKENNKKKNSPSGSFSKPTPAEIQDYCDERKNNLSGENIFDHYEANGWMRGKSKVKDWKACVRTWEKNNKSQGVDKKFESVSTIDLISMASNAGVVGAETMSRDLLVSSLEGAQ